MSEPDALRCPGCGEPLPASIELLTGALRCERCGLEVPIPEPPAPDLAFDTPPAEPRAAEPPTEPVVDWPPPPRTLAIEHWFQDANPAGTVPTPPEGLPTVEDEAPPSEPPAEGGASPLAELTPADSPPDAGPILEPAPPADFGTNGVSAEYSVPSTSPPEAAPEPVGLEPPPLPTEPPPLPGAAPEPPPLPAEGLLIIDAPVPGVPLLPTPPVLPATADEPEVLVAEEPLPLVKPVAPVVKAVSPAARTDPDRPRPRTAPAPRPRDGEVARPKPQVGLALVVMAALLLVVALGLAVIGYAIWSGLQTAAKPRRAEAVYDGAAGQGVLMAWPARR